MQLIGLVILLICVRKCLSAGPEVTARTGTYVGLPSKTFSGKEYVAFLGIKFANVVKRFQEAEPAAEDSSKLLNATKFGPACFQQDNSTIGEEDCLYLNVYTPQLTGNLPVLFFIYGGAFSMGATFKYDPEFFMESQRIVVITVAYRLGPFGFLYLNDPSFPANLGLRDQILGLKWVRDNVRKFGGDPDRVTINGQSAGAASVNILMHSPQAKGLFVGGISESGTSCSPWALQPRCTGLYKLTLLAKNTNCSQFLPSGSGWTADKLVGCLSQVSAKQMLVAVKQFPKWDLIVPFPPILEPETVANPVITIFPWLTKVDAGSLVPWISGTNSAEAALLVKQYYPKGLLEFLAVRIFNGFVLSDLLYYRYTASHPAFVTAQIKFHYFADNIFNFQRFISEILTEAFFSFPNSQCLSTSRSPSYSYFFNYTPEKMRTEFNEVGHGGEIPYFWKQDSNIRLDGTRLDSQISQHLVNAWIDFAYHQSTNFSDVTWERYEEAKDRVLIIDDKGIRMGPNPARQQNSFWRSLETNLNPMIKNCD